MVFKKMLRNLGVSGATVDTVLEAAQCQPGGILRGQVNLAAGDAPVKIEHVALGLVTRVEVEHSEHESTGQAEFHRVQVCGALTLAAGERQSVAFELPVPWETPVTHVYGQALHGMTMGVRTEVSIARAIDKGDLDAVAVHPLPAQQQILDAMSGLGFRFKGADLEAGRLRGVPQTLPFYQEIEFYPPSFASGINEAELSFVAGPQGMDVILEVDKRGGLFTSGQDAFGHLRVDYATAAATDWAAQIDAWIRQSAQRRSGFGQSAGPGKTGHHGRGGMAAGMAAGAGAGLLGGMVAGEVLDEVGDFFGGDEE
jgi:sporulation-control protein